VRFTHDTLAQRVVFASGQAATGIAAEVERLGARRCMVVAGPANAELAGRITAGIPVAHLHDEVAMHVPVETANRAREAAAAHRVDAIVSVGGGSTTGLAKAIALTSGLPVIAVPTTYAGSEATDVWGLTEGRTKTTGSDPRVLPRSVVYDATLTSTLPKDMAVASGLNALAHCVDSLWAPRADPINTVLATEGARALNTGLARMAKDPTDLSSREQVLYGAYLAAVAFSSAGAGIHHKICHVLGGRYNLPHAQTHAVVLPYVVALNMPNAPDAQARLATAFGSASALEGLQALRVAVDAPRRLRDYGLAEEDLPDAVNAILPVVPSTNPTPATVDNIGALLHAAWEGAHP
jgi:maleylacetate reductase